TAAACPPPGTRDRPRGGAAPDGDHRHRRAARRSAAAGDLQRHRRLHPQERTLPRDGRGWEEGGCGMSFYRGATALFGVAFLGIGIALLVVTAANGGGVLGYVLGLLFVALGI